MSGVSMPMVKVDRGARGAVEPPVSPERHAESLAHQIVQAAEMATRAAALPASVVSSSASMAFELKGVVAEQRRVAGQRRLDGLERLAVEARRRGLAPPFDAVGVGDPHHHRAILAVAAARDDERVAGVQGQDFGAEAQRHGIESRRS